MDLHLKYRVFDWLRFPLIVGVVFIHSFGKPYDYEAIDFCHFTAIDFYNLFRVSISFVLTHVCVPVFFFISGYLFFKGLEIWDNRNYLQKIRRRMKTLLVPFLLWNTIKIILYLKYAIHHGLWDVIQSFLYNNGFFHLYWDCIQWNLGRTNWLGVPTPASSPFLVTLWFLRDLMVVVICSPVLYFLFDKAKKWGILLLLVCYLSGVFINVPGFSTTAFLFFGLGGYFKINDIDPIQVMYKYRYYAFIIALITWISCTLWNGHETEIGNLIYPFYVLSGSVTTINLAGYMVRNNLMSFLCHPLLSKGAFFIYLSHTLFFIEFYTKVSLFCFGEDNPFLLIISYLIVPVLTILTCLLLYFILKMVFPSICSILTGER